MEDNVPIDEDHELNNILDGVIFFEEFVKDVLCILHLKAVDLNQYS